MLTNFSTLIALLIVPVICSSAFANSLQKAPPNTIDLKMGAKTLTFEHKKHIKLLDSICIYCHQTEKGMIDGGFGKDTARILCIPCHDESPSFKSDCKGCHNAEKAIVSK